MTIDANEEAEGNYIKKMKITKQHRSIHHQHPNDLRGSRSQEDIPRKLRISLYCKFYCLAISKLFQVFKPKTKQLTSPTKHPLTSGAWIPRNPIKQPLLWKNKNQVSKNGNRGRTKTARKTERARNPDARNKKANGKTRHDSPRGETRTLQLQQWQMEHIKSAKIQNGREL